MPESTVQANEPASFRWEQKPNESIALIGPKGVVWQCNYGTLAAKPHFHPVALLSGEVLTCDRPADHAWHHAVWFSWKSINGVNYWEEDPQTGNSAGATSWTNVEVSTRDDGEARIAMDLSYSVQAESAVLTERRVVEISAPDDNSQSYSMDWLATFTAGDEDVLLDRTPIPPDPQGKTWGGYAGLSIRFANEMTERQAVSTSGQVRFDEDSLHRSNGAAMDYSGLIGARLAGIAILDHPENPRYPTPWYAIRTEMSYLNAAFLTHEPYTLPAGESFTLRYRLIVHPHRWDAQTLRGASEEFTSQRRH